MEETSSHITDKHVANAVQEGLDLLELFYDEFSHGLLGMDKKQAQAKFLHRHGLNSNPDVLDEDL